MNVEIKSIISDNNHDGSQNWTQRNSATPTSLFSQTTALSIGSSNTADNVRAFFFVFRFGDGTADSGIPQGASIQDAKLNFRANNGTTTTNAITRIYIAVENDLDPLGTGAIVSGTAGTMPWRRLGRQSNAVDIFGPRCGPTHTGDLATTGASVRDSNALVYKAFADGRSITATSFNLTDDFGPALQALVDDPNWDSSSQYVRVYLFSDPNVAAGTDGVGLLNGVSWASGQTGTSTTYSSSAAQMTFRNNNVAHAAELILNIELPQQDVNVTTVAPSVNLAFGEDRSVHGYTDYRDVSYHDGIGNSTRRLMNIHIPNNVTPPETGFPIALYVHGGGWGGGAKEDILGHYELMADILTAGFAVVSFNYKFTNADDIGNNTATGWVRPSQVQDAFAALAFIKANQDTYNLDADRIVGFSYSAGGHILLETALAIEDPGRDSYSITFRGESTTQGTRYPNYPTNILTQGRDIEDIPSIKAIFSLAGPVNLKRIDEINPLAGFLMKLYFGRRPFESYTATMNQEGNLDDYIRGASGSIYASKGPTVPGFAIALLHATGDTTVPTAASFTALNAALTEVGYDTSTPNGVVANGIAFSHKGEAIFGGAGGHDTIYRRFDRQFERTWLQKMLNMLYPGESNEQVKVDGVFQNASSQIKVDGSFTNASFKRKVNGEFI